MRKSISSVPVAPGSPYSPAVLADNQLYVSGQLPLDSAGNMPKSVSEQTKQCMENIKTLVELAGFTMADIVKTTVYMTDFHQISDMNTVYSTYFPNAMPARCACEVSSLARNAMVEIDCIAIKDRK